MAATSLALDALIGVVLLALVEAVAWIVEARRASPPAVSARERLATLAQVLALAGGLSAIVAFATTLPVGGAAVLAALGVAAVVLVVRVLLSLGSAASRS